PFEAWVPHGGCADGFHFLDEVPDFFLGVFFLAVFFLGAFWGALAPADAPGSVARSAGASGFGSSSTRCRRLRTTGTEIPSIPLTVISPVYATPSASFAFTGTTIWTTRCSPGASSSLGGTKVTLALKRAPPASANSDATSWHESLRPR